MCQKLIISFLFYLSGVIISPVFANAELDLNKNLVIGLGEDIPEDGRIADEVLRDIFDVEGNGHSGSFIFFTSTSKGFAIIAKGLPGSVSFRRAWVSPYPLYLLFHSFLFYDLI